MAVKLRAPEGSAGCSWGGIEYKADAKGAVEVPEAAAKELEAHGFTVYVERPEAEAETPKRGRR